MDGWRRRALHWTAANEPERKLALFSLSELFVLGGGDVSEVHAWGTAMTPSWGCLCTRMPAPNAWRLVTGRPQAGVLGSSVPDVMLHVAAGLHELDLPAGVAKSVLSTAMQQFVDTVRPNDGNDWLALVRGALTITRERLEDFVAAAAAVGGPLVPRDRGGPHGDDDAPTHARRGRLGGLSAGRRRRRAPLSEQPDLRDPYPDAEPYLAGPVVLRAIVDPPCAVAKVEFFVDGREVCAIETARRSSANGTPARMSSSGRSGWSRTSPTAGAPRAHRPDARALASPRRSTSTSCR